jgi:hypothetical protein
MGLDTSLKGKVMGARINAVKHFISGNGLRIIEVEKETLLALRL